MNRVTLTDTDCRQALLISEIGVIARIAPAPSGRKVIAASASLPLKLTCCTPARSPNSLSGEFSGNSAET